MDAHVATLELGAVVATPGAIEALAAADQGPREFLERHLNGDWGEVSSEDWALNDRSVRDGLRILSAYMLKTSVKIWIITEADRSVTTILLPEEY